MDGSDGWKTGQGRNIESYNRSRHDETYAVGIQLVWRQVWLHLPNTSKAEKLALTTELICFRNPNELSIKAQRFSH